MTDVIVSIRMPSSLVAKLKDIAKHGHFLDVSELMRSLVRDVWMERTQPTLYEVKKLRQDIQETVRQKTVAKVQQQVKKELDTIRERLREDLE